MKALVHEHMFFCGWVKRSLIAGLAFDMLCYKVVADKGARGASATKEAAAVVAEGIR